MAILVMDGFDSYNADTTDFKKAGWDSAVASTNTVGVVTDAAVTRKGSGNYLRIYSPATTSVSTLISPTFAATASPCVGFALYLNEKPYEFNSSVFLGVFDGTTEQCRLVLNPSTGLDLYNGTTLLGFSTTNIPIRRWVYLECKFVIADGTGGSCIINMDGGEILNVPDVDTQVSGDAQATLFKFGAYVISGSRSVTMYLDDILIHDSTFVGDVNIACLLPSADTADKDFLRSTGSDNYALIDDPSGIHNDDTDYVYTSTDGDRDVYELTSLPSNTNKVKGVALETWSRLEASGSSLIKHVLVSDDTTDVSSGYALTTSYAPDKTIYDEDPDGPIAWTVSKTEALQAGQEANIV